MKKSTKQSTITAALTAVNFVSGPWCISVTWGWFAVPLGVPPIGFAHAIGLAMLIFMLWNMSYMVRIVSDEAMSDRAKEIEGIDVDRINRDRRLCRSIGTFVLVWTTFGIGWLAHLAMSTTLVVQ